MKSGRPSVDLLSDYGYALYLKEDLESAERKSCVRSSSASLVIPQPETTWHWCWESKVGSTSRSKSFVWRLTKPEALANLAYVKTHDG